MTTEKKKTAAAGGGPDLLNTMKRTIVQFRMMHMQARVVLLASHQIIKSMNAGERHYDDFCAFAQGLADLNLAMVKQQTELIDQIHAAEQAVSQLH